MIRSARARLSRPAPSRGRGPGGREAVRDGAPAACDRPPVRDQDVLWELWGMRALFPRALPADLLAIKAERDAFLAREREALAGLWSGERGYLSPGHGFWAANPDLACGLTVSLHLGPYQLLAEPYLAAGRRPLIVLNEDARRSFLPHAEALSRRLGHPGRLQWASLAQPDFVRRMAESLRTGQPVLAYLDGNAGGASPPGARDRTLIYQLPGRDLRVRTGLARLACRLGCPVHRVAVFWDEQGRPVWDRAPTLRWDRDHDVEQATRVLFDWCFAHITRRPAQWHHWPMLRHAAACFAGAGDRDEGVPSGLREDFRRAFQTCLDRSPQTVHLVLEADAAVWPGDVLADLSQDRFYPGLGLQDAELDLLREGQPTLADLQARLGRPWVLRHGLRLCLLGMARLGGAAA